jgi:hypothetical protein
MSESVELPTKTEILTEKVLMASNQIEAKSVIQDVKATVASEATTLAVKRKTDITLLKERTQTFLAVSITSATIFSALTSTEIPDTLTNALFTVLGFFLREKIDEKLNRTQNTRSTD